MESGCGKHIAQMPVVLIPVHFDRDQATRSPSCQRSVVLRPFLSADFMTGLPAVPGTDKLPMEVCLGIFASLKKSGTFRLISFGLLQVVDRMVRDILMVPGISRVLYDLTSKPPGTTEWE